MFEVEPVEWVETDSAAAKPPVDKTFRRFDPDQGLLLPPSLDDWLPAEHLARFIAELVDEHLDLSRIGAAYTEGRGGPPYDPRLMVRILLYGYTIGVRSSRVIETKCVDDVPFRWLAAGAAPDYRAIARFRKRHLSALGHLFVQALALCQAAGMVSLGRVALDGTKVRANASKRKAMSDARMSEKEKVLAEEVSALLLEAERIDKAEDTKFGKNRGGDELPEGLRRRESRLAKIREAKAALEEEAAQAARVKAENSARERGDDDDTVTSKGEAAAQQAVPKPKAQRNFTDPDSKIMLTGDGAFHQCYNAQAVVDADHQVIVATDVNTNASDVGNLMPMTEQAAASTGATPNQVLADAGYCSADNLDQAASYATEHGTEFFIATGRHHRGDPPVASRGRIPADATEKQRMARKLTTKTGQKVYAHRKAIVEPVFGQMATLQNAKHLLLRGFEQARGEWLLLAACHNLRKLHGHLGTTGLAGLAVS
ncbi:IS1182 family transposase [Mycobacterium heckeshornense]|uniref:IS1182 family transposase n=1 Tax=Mycobacterium heckeshornense TaxID=110505 RepID=UPI00066251C4|nr:IS1182 family transposase [Mycobacterium heckeshornense]KMV14807.1 transposase [Mycobacterium heckeshornense]MCV7035750.1 IS1182 family transposase [Mycobacterium heckeshornense]PIJ34071.1 IS1182 family transposase [Mycobacterium heckeshornense]